MKQTKKPTRSQRLLLERQFNIEAVGVRIVEETKEYITIQYMSGNIETLYK